MNSNFQAVEFLAPTMVGILSVLYSPDVATLEVFAKKKKKKETYEMCQFLPFCIKNETKQMPARFSCPKSLTPITSIISLCQTIRDFQARQMLSSLWRKI